MGTMSQQIIFKLAYGPHCRLAMAALAFQQFDAKGKLMPMQLEEAPTVQGPFSDNGTATITLKPGEETAITVATADGTGYDASVRCAKRMTVRIAKQPHPFQFPTSSCSKVMVSGFHALEE
jgi:hypothetical protein